MGGEWGGGSFSHAVSRTLCQLCCGAPLLSSLYQATEATICHRKTGVSLTFFCRFTVPAVG